MILDLDETLVHCDTTPIIDHHFQFEIEIEGNASSSNFFSQSKKKKKKGILHHIYAKKRPHLEQFLENVSKKFEIIIFTASQERYANIILDLIDPEKKYLQ